jgi:hypothetical protein
MHFKKERRNVTLCHCVWICDRLRGGKPELPPPPLTNGTNQAPLPIRLKREKRERYIRLMNGFITTLCPVPTAARFCINTFAHGDYFCWFFDVRSAPCLKVLHCQLRGLPQHLRNLHFFLLMIDNNLGT